MTTETTCTTCGRPASQPYRNDTADERCNDPMHTTLCNCNKLGNVTHTMGIAGCAYGPDDVTVTVTREVAEALCTAAEFLVEPNPAGPGTVWVSNETGDVFATTDEALVKALPRIAEIGTFWRADNYEMAEAQREVIALDPEPAEQEDRANAQENWRDEPPADNDPENGPNEADARADYEDHVRRLEQAADNRPAVGARVLFVDQLDRYPFFTVPAGATGVVTNSDDDYYAVKVDQPIAGAEEFDNEVIWSLGDDEEPATDLRLAGAFVKHEVISEMSYDDLGKAIAEGGPSDLIDAMIAERRERQRKADSIYHGDWDEQGTVSVHLPAGDNVHWAGWLEARGWTFRGGRWNSPGDDSSVFYLSEALQRQLLAEALR